MAYVHLRSNKHSMRRKTAHQESKMKSKPWNVPLVAAIGLVPGAIYSFYKGYWTGEFEGGVSSGIGFIIGGAIACAALFALVAFIRNRVVRVR